MEKYNYNFWPPQIKKSADSLNIKIDQDTNAFICQIINEGSPEISSLDLLKCLHNNGDALSLSTVAKNYLLVAGIFPYHNLAKTICIGDMINLGSLALYYASCDHTANTEERALFRKLHQNTVLVTDILMQTKDNISNHTTLTYADARLLYASHQSKYAKKILNY